MISVYPFIEKRPLAFKKIRMAMALRSKNTHYKWHTIQPRHWLSQAEKVRFSKPLMSQIIGDVYSALGGIIRHVTDQLPSRFSADISDPIFKNMKKVKQKYISSTS